MDWAKVLEGEEAPKSKVRDATKIDESDRDNGGTIEPKPWEWSRHKDVGGDNETDREVREDRGAKVFGIGKVVREEMFIVSVGVDIEELVWRTQLDSINGKWCSWKQIWQEM